MCYQGCRYENRNGGCNKPVSAICPQKEYEENQDILCETCVNLYVSVSPDGTEEKCMQLNKQHFNEVYEGYENSCKYYEKI